MPLGLPQLTALLVSGGPNTVHELYHPDGSRSQAGPADRQQQLDELTGHVHRFVAQGADLARRQPRCTATRASRDAVQAAPVVVAVLEPGAPSAPHRQRSTVGGTGCNTADAAPASARCRAAEEEPKNREISGRLHEGSDPF